MSPLATQIYTQLQQRVRAHQTSPLSMITYGELAGEISRAAPELAVHPRSSTLHAALGEVSEACRAAGLPCLTALVCRADTRQPSHGYYKVAHPRVRSDDGRVAAWEREQARIVAEVDRFPGALP